MRDLMLEVRDPADVREVVGEVPTLAAAEVAAANARARAGFAAWRRTAVLDRAEAGQVSVNLPTSGWDVHHPFGGFRDSGSLFKEQGAPGLRFYTRIKTSAVRFAW